MIMKPVVFTLFWYLAVASSQNPLSTVTQYASKNQFQYVASVRLAKNNRHLCMGSVIHFNWVLSSAICYTDEVTSKPVMAAKDLVIYADTVDSKSTKGPTSRGKKLITHPKYRRTSNTVSHNIALIELSKDLYWFWQPLISGAKKRIAFGKAGNHGGTVVSAGWSALNEFGKYVTTDKLRYYYFNIVGSKGRCISNSDIICAAATANDICHYDAGGPLIDQSGKLDKLIGIFSHSYSNRCTVQIPDAFTRVETYVPWIQNITGKKN